MPADLSARLFARFYARATKDEPAELRALRTEALGTAAGRTLEVGTGDGANVPLYPAAVTELVLSDPSPYMLRHLRRRLAEAPPPVPEWSVVEAGADALPFTDGHFDTVLATFVLCSVPDVARALDEIARVLVPGGRFLFLEHVRAEPGTVLARVQDLVERPHRVVGAGCRPNRRTGEIIERSALELSEMRPVRNPIGIPTVRPLIVGAARRAGDGIMDRDAG